MPKTCSMDAIQSFLPWVMRAMMAHLWFDAFWESVVQKDCAGGLTLSLVIDDEIVQ